MYLLCIYWVPGCSEALRGPRSNWTAIQRPGARSLCLQSQLILCICSVPSGGPVLGHGGEEEQTLSLPCGHGPLQIREGQGAEGCVDWE